MFRLPPRAADVRIVSRAAAPQELGLARDPRMLGVALRRLIVRQGARSRVIGADDERLLDGFYPFETENDVRWTDGEAVLDPSLYAGFAGAVELVLHLGGATQYCDETRSARVA